MGVSQAARDAAGNEHGQFLGQRAAFVGELMRELFQVHAPDQFHRNESHAVRLAKLVGLDDVRVNQVGDELGLADKILEEHFLAGEIGADDFDGDAFDKSARAVLLGFIHDAHAALKNFADDFIAEFVLDGEKRHARMVGNCPAMSSLAAAWQRKNRIFFDFFACTAGVLDFYSHQVW